MAECNLGFTHEDPEPVVVEAPDTEPVAEAEVEIARINAQRDVKVAQISNRVTDEETVALIAALQARVDVLESANAPAQQEEQQAVVVVPDAEPEPEMPTEPAPEPSEEPAPKAEKKRSAWWG